MIAALRRIISRKPAPAPRDEQGRFVSAHRREVLSKAHAMALQMGRPDLAAKLEGVGE